MPGVYAAVLKGVEGEFFYFVSKKKPSFLSSVSCCLVCTFESSIVPI